MLTVRTWMKLVDPYQLVFRMHSQHIDMERQHRINVFSIAKWLERQLWTCGAAHPWRPTLLGLKLKIDIGDYRVHDSQPEIKQSLPCHRNALTNSLYLSRVGRAWRCVSICMLAAARRWIYLYLTIFTKYNHFTSNGNDGGCVHGGGWGKPELSLCGCVALLCTSNMCAIIGVLSSGGPCRGLRIHSCLSGVGRRWGSLRLRWNRFVLAIYLQSEWEVCFALAMLVAGWFLA